VEEDALLVELADRPVRLLSLFLKDLDLALQALGRGAGLGTCTGFVLVGFDLRFELLDLALQHRVLVAQGCDLLLLLCRLALELLDLGLELLGAGAALVRLDAESFHALWGLVSSNSSEDAHGFADTILTARSSAKGSGRGR